MRFNPFSRNKKVNKEEKEEEAICIECDIKNQKDLPTTDVLSSKGSPCENEYLLVSSYMRDNGNQVSACATQWDAFKLCHAKEKESRVL